MKKFMFLELDRYKVSNTTTHIIESDKELLDVFEEVLLDKIYGDVLYDWEEEWEMIKDKTHINEKQCGFDDEEYSFLLIEF